MLTESIFTKTLDAIEAYCDYTNKLASILGVIFEDNGLVTAECSILKILCECMTDEGAQHNTELIEELIYAWCYEAEFGLRYTALESVCKTNSLSIPENSQELYQLILTLRNTN